MLNPFPQLLILGLLAPFILRVALGILFLINGSQHLSRERRESLTAQLQASWGTLGSAFAWYLGVVELLIGLMLVAGFLTQIAALIGIIIALKLLAFRKRYVSIAPHGTLFYLLVIAVCASLLLSGAGALAIDLPL